MSNKQTIYFSRHGIREDWGPHRQEWLKTGTRIICFEERGGREEDCREMKRGEKGREAREGIRSGRGDLD
jgi:hypothetical protein